MSQSSPFIFLVFLLILPVLATKECISQASGLELSVFEDPQYGNVNFDALEKAFFPTNDQESLSVDIKYSFNGYPHRNITFRWAWSSITLFIYPFDFQFLSLFTVRYSTGSCTVQIAAPLCSNVSEDEIERLMNGFTQTIRGNIVNGYSSSDGRNLDNHQTGYFILLDKEDNTIKTKVGLLLAGAFLSTVIPCLMALIMQALKWKPSARNRRSEEGRLLVDQGENDTDTQSHEAVEETQSARNEPSQKNDSTSADRKADIEHDRTRLDPHGGDDTHSQPQSNEAQSTVEGTGSARDDEEKQIVSSYLYGCTVTLYLLAPTIAITEIIHFGFGVAPHSKTEKGQPKTFEAVLAVFLFLLFLDSLIVVYISWQLRKKKCLCIFCGLSKMMMTMLGVQLLLFHAPFIFLGLWSLPYQATITIAMYLSGIIVFTTGISLSRYVHLYLKKCCCSEVLMILTTLLTVIVIGLLSYVVIEVMHYFHSTDDISQTGQVQLFSTLLSLAIPTTFIVFLWKKYLRMCKMIKGWLDESRTT